jgi:hypothetical protein
MTSWFRSIFGGMGQRTSGRPTSSNGASSFHLWWDVPTSEPIIGASVTLEVADRPDIDDLVFMAMQVSFDRPAGGGAHLGLQHHPRFPERSAVNWGGYAPGGGLLSGSVSPLPSTPGDLNTRDFPWRAGEQYRLDVVRGRELADDGWAWIGSVTDAGGSRTLVRELFSGGSTIRTPLMWVECFAPCDAPAFTVRWSDPTVTTVDSGQIPIRSVRTAYQTASDGGCTNTTSSVDGSTFTQRTDALRTTPQGARLSVE